MPKTLYISVSHSGNKLGENTNQGGHCPKYIMLISYLLHPIKISYFVKGYFFASDFD